ncbi:MAG: hypothetical protein KUG78_15355 [Kangiellaceae bacterium]|nr:hypothetical protein [Kangiellaceae bacterium]
MNPNKLILILAAILAAVAPLAFSDLAEQQNLASSFSGWPTEYEGKELIPLALTEKEKIFTKGFPGKIARFSDGQRELIIRWIEQPTRKLHPAADCFKGIGYYIKPKPIKINKNGIKMGCFTANKNEKELNVCEYIEAQNGDNWSDISAWYWGAITSNSRQGWMSFVIAENTR